jgi:polar amino acid transport system substrate-binding protein
MKLSAAAIVVTALLGPATAWPQAPRPIVLAGTWDQHGPGAGLLLTMIYTEAFRQLDMPLQIRVLPAMRASAEAVAGNVDGELARAYDYGRMQPSLIRIEEPVLYVTAAAYAHKPGIKVQGWDSLRGTGYRVEYRNGYVVVRQRLESVVAPDNLSSVNRGEQGLRKVMLGRTDLYVDTEEFAQPLLQSEAFRGSGIYNAGVLERAPTYGYLIKGHEKLALRLAEVLRSMRASGQLERLRGIALDPSRGPCAATPASCEQPAPP